MPFGNAAALLVSNRVFALKRLRNSVSWWLLNGFLYPRIRLLATVPSSGPDLQITGQCIGEVDETIPRHVPLASSIRLANATADDLRLEFLAYFQSKRHTIVAPSSIFPKTHEGSYFVNAGMNQFKSLILGQKSTASSVQFTRLSRATNSQPCIRLGGRHDDLNDVGYDRQHHTMFEMLGSWSFGDYYKEKACHFMWDFVTKVLGLPKNALYVTYFGGCPKMGLPADDVTRDIWLRLGVMDQKLLPFGIAHNFWRAGNASGAGLCGPSTELHVDFHSLQDADGLQCARCLINTTSPQVVELWNTVFISHRTRATEHGKLTADSLDPLRQQFVDTGMGLERLACVMQGATSTYDTDVFQPLLEFIQAKATTSSWTPPAYAGEFIPFCRQPSQTETENQAAVEEEKSAVTTTVRSFSSLFRKLLSPKRARRPFCANQNCSEQTGERVNLHSISASVTGSSTEDHDLLDRWHRDTAYRLMVDHSRALAHALSDGLLPGRQGLGLKLRQLIHRAARASVLTGLDPLTQSRSVLGSLVAEVARRSQLAVPSATPMLQGPSARQPSRLSYEEMEALVTKEVLAVLPRLEAQEEAFHQCLDENPDGTRLSPEQVSRLLNGNYGTPVSWDMLCAQSHWFGLCVPEAPLSSSSSTSCTPASSSSSRANTSTPTHQSQSRPDQSVAMAEQLYLANFKPSDDTAKYNYVRQNSSLDSASGYDIPTIEARLLAVFVNDAEANRTHLLRSTDDVSHVSLNSNQILSGRVGLVFDQTNFFASAGGQDSDKGVIRLSSSDTEFEVVDVESVPNPKEPQHFWIVHWCLLRIPVGRSPTPAQFQFDQPYALQVDSERRVQLMRNHTAQHLFAWAVEQVALSNQSDGFRELQHQGGSVHPDRFVVNTALVDQASTRAVEQDAVGFVRHLENLCRDVIRQRLDVRRVQTKWSSVVKNSKVRRFPWMDYPDIVTAVCIGKPIVLESSSTETAESATPNSSAELCAGTHVVNTADLIDLVVVALRDRKQAVKQFVGIVGEPARQARLRGDSLLASAQNREARIATHPSELSEHIDWLTTELAQHADHLPYADRECLQACLLRLRTQRNLGSSAELDVQQIKQLVSHMRTEITQTNGIVQIGSNPPYRPELVAVAISQLEPSHTVIVCSGRTAVCYFPHHTSIPSHSASFSALDLAHRIAHYLTTVHSEILSPGQVKARPVRSNSISAEFLMKLASLQLMVDGRNWADAELCTVLECALNDAVLANQSRSVP